MWIAVSQPKNIRDILCCTDGENVSDVLHMYKKLRTFYTHDMEQKAHAHSKHLTKNIPAHNKFPSTYKYMTMETEAENFTNN
jgi:hypothetical protein